VELLVDGQIAASRDDTILGGVTVCLRFLQEMKIRRVKTEFPKAGLGLGTS
jgi:hypothetical protein